MLNSTGNQSLILEKNYPHPFKKTFFLRWVKSLVLSYIQLSRERGTTTIITTHYVEEAKGAAKVSKASML